jgi:hypothetical protein
LLTVPAVRAHISHLREPNAAIPGIRTVICSPFSA